MSSTKAIRHFLSQLTYLPRTFRLIWSSTRHLTTYWAILLLSQGLLPILSVYLLRSLVNAITAALQTSRAADGFQNALLLLGLLIGVQLLAEGLRVLSAFLRAKQSELVQDHIADLIHRQSVNVDLAFYDSPQFYDHLHRAREESNIRPLTILESTGAIVQNSITLVAMAVVLLRFGGWIPLALLVSALPAFFIAARYTRRHHDWVFRSTADRRRAAYYSWCLTAREPASEVRLFLLGDYFAGCYRALRERLKGQRLKLLKDQNAAEFAVGAIGYLIAAASLIWILRQTFRGRFSLGDVALFYQAFYQGQRLMRSVLENLTTLYGNSLFLGNLFEFLDLKSTILTPDRPKPVSAPLKGTIEFKDVSFCYPGTDRKALGDFNLMIPAGTIVAIVGPNGAGKTTVIKLLCRFYDPDLGAIEVDGIDLRELKLDHLRRIISAQFQTSIHYSATAGENIFYGDQSISSTNGNVEAAATAAQADEIIERLPNRYETQLGTWFDGGHELSVGEWRRISLARALFRSSPVILLDEPTSAMDSWAEAKWMSRFRKAAGGRTAIIITHRFLTAMHADQIHVMQNGRIVESGSHDELLQIEGLYAESWRNQTRSSSLEFTG